MMWEAYARSQAKEKEPERAKERTADVKMVRKAPDS